MKKLIILLLITISLNAFGQVPSYIPSSGLKAYYPFNGNTNDESGNGNNGTNNGATLTADRYNIANKAYSFNGSTAWINSNLMAGFGNALSLVVWLKSSQNTPGGIICSRYGPGRLNGIESNGSDVGLDLTDSTDHAYQSYTYGVNYNNNNWHCVVGTYDGTTSKIYVDGVLKNSNAFSINIKVRAVFKIGIDDLFSRYFNGILDDICIYDRALTVSEINSIYNGCTLNNVSINPLGSTTFCQGGNVVLNCNTIGTNNTYQWKKNGVNITGATTSSYTASEGGSYLVEVDSLGCKGVSTAVLVNVNPIPNVTLNPIGNFTNLYQGAINLTGNPVGGTFSGKGVSGNYFNPSIAGLGTAKIAYTYSNTNNCSNTASQNTIVYDTLKSSSFDTLIIKVVLTGVSAPNNVNTLRIYPNPAKTHIYIDNGNFNLMNGYSVKITNSLSQSVYQAAITQQQVYIDLSAWNDKGLYFVRILDNLGNEIVVKKIILE